MTVGNDKMTTGNGIMAITGVKKRNFLFRKLRFRTPGDNKKRAPSSRERVFFYRRQSLRHQLRRQVADAVDVAHFHVAVRPNIHPADGGIEKVEKYVMAGQHAQQGF